MRLAYLTQEVRELERYADWRVIEAIEDVRKYIRLGKKEISASQLAQRLGFTGGRQQTRVSDLSGGERRRLQLTRLLMDEPNVLLLDEPTNDLDIETLTSLEDVLDGWAGTLLVVSHDRYLLERVCDKQVALIGDGKIRELPGGVEQYLELRHAQPAPTLAPRTSGSPSSPQASTQLERNLQAVRRPAASTGPPAPTHSPAELREARKDMARVEKQLARLAQREERHPRRDGRVGHRPREGADPQRPAARDRRRTRGARARVARGRRDRRLRTQAPRSRCSGLERGEQPPQHRGELVAVVGGQLREQVALAVEQVGHRVVDGALTRGGEPHDDAAAVGGVGAATRPDRVARAGRPGWSSCRW